jgi:hypothetical protein
MVREDKDAEARKLAAAHYEVEVGITQIFRLTGTAEAEGLPDEPIKLLEVNENTIPAGIMPLGFGPAPTHGIHYPSVIVEVTPDEFQRIQSKELVLPKGWTISDLVPRPPGKNGE